MSRGNSRRAGVWKLALTLVGAAFVGLLLPTAAAAEPRPIPPPALADVPPLPGSPAAPAGLAAQVALLKATPESGKVGARFTLSGEGLPANEDIDVVWSTVKGSYILNPLPDTVEFWGRQLDPINVVLAKTRTDSSGRLRIDLTAPEDYGEIHDIYAVADGLQVAKGGFRIARAVTISPKKGPIGTPITIKVTGLGWKPFESTAAVLYDNRYAGYISATTTRGTATVQIRAAGPVGTHTIEVGPASHAVNYLNIEQSPVWFVGKYRFTFKATKDNGPPPAIVDWPERVDPTEVSRTAVTGATDASVSANLASSSGPILSKLDLKATGLSPDVPVELAWVTAAGARASPSGWSLTTSLLDLAQQTSLARGQAAPAADGSLTTAFAIPDDLGGWHSVQLIQNGKVKAEVPYYVERSLVEVTPAKVRAGQVFQIHLKGIGWTELDNGFAVSYDTGYIGYACGFNSRGDVTMNLVAAGGPGTHLIDLYPMIYKGKGKGDALWQSEVPMLSFKMDAPGLALGYRLPAFRLAIEVVE